MPRPRASILLRILIPTAVGAVLIGKWLPRPSHVEPDASIREPSPKSSDRAQVSHDEAADYIPELAPDKGKLPNTIRNLAIQIEAEAAQWQREHPRNRRFHRLQAAHLDQRVADLGTREIKILADWQLRGPLPHISLLSHNRALSHALLREWAFREPNTAHAAVEAYAADKNYNAEYVSYELCEVFKGHARRNPEEAWSRYSDYEAVPELLRALGGTGETLQAIISEWAKSDPDASWEALTGRAWDSVEFDQIVEAYAFGLPDGQDWRALTSRALTEADQRKSGYETSIPTPFAARWLAENPLATLEWYADLIMKFRIKGRSPTNNPDPEQSISSHTVIKSGLIAYLHHADHPISDRTKAVLNQVIESGDIHLAAESMRTLIDLHLDQDELHFLDLIVKIPDQSSREELLLDVIRSTQVVPVSSDPFATPTPGEPMVNPAEKPIRALMRQMRLSPEATAAANAAFAEIEAKSARIRDEPNDF